MLDETLLTRTTATAILGIDTLFGGDVIDPSGTGRFIADSWFSDEPLPGRLHPPDRGGAPQGGRRDRQGARTWPPSTPTSTAVDVAAAVKELARLAGAGRRPARRLPRRHGRQPAGHVGAGPGAARPRARRSTTTAASSPPPARPPSRPPRPRSAAGWPSCSAKAGYRAGTPEELLAAVDAWRAERLVPKKSIAQLADAFIAQLDEGTRRHLVPHLPAVAARRAARQHHLPPHHRRLVLRLDELRGPGPQPRRLAAVRGHLRDQRLAGDLGPRVRPAGQPRGGAGPRHQLRARPRGSTSPGRWASRPPSSP